MNITPADASELRAALAGPNGQALLAHEHVRGSWVDPLVERWREACMFPEAATDGLLALAPSIAPASGPLEAEVDFGLSAGLLDEDSLAAYSQGWCWLLAAELSWATGWPTVVLCARRCALTETNVPRHWMHALVRAPNGRLVDMDGVHDERALLKTWGEERAVTVKASSLVYEGYDGYDPLRTSPQLVAHNASLTRSIARVVCERITAAHEAQIA